MIRFDTGDERFWEEFARFLQAEVELAEDLKRKTALLCVLAHIREERMGDPEGAWKLLCEARDLAPSDSDVLWESWRIGSRRDLEAKMRVLEYLSIIQDIPRDIVSCRVLMAKLRRDVLQDEVAAQTELQEALWLMPDARDVLWTQVEDFLGRDDTMAALAPLEKLAELSEDPSWKASLYCAVASLRLCCKEPPEWVEAALAEALEQPKLDWANTNDILRTGIEIESWSLVDRALEVMAKAASGREPAPDSERPAGWGFESFDRGDDAAAASWWHMALVRERRLEDTQGAVEALRRASALVPGHPFLEMELVRLLEAAGRPKDALEALPKFAPPAWRIQLALSAGDAEVDASFLTTDDPGDRSLVAAVIEEWAPERKDPPSDQGASDARLAKWLILHPGHEKAYDVAAGLLERGSDCPIAALVVEEGRPPEAMWPTPDVDPSPPVWSLAVEAVWFGGDEAPKDVAQRFVRWANRTEDVTLCSVLYSLAALFVEENEAEAATALEFFKKAREKTPRASLAKDGVFRLLRQLGHWGELSKSLSEAASMAQDEQHALELLYQKAIVEEQGVGDRAAAGRLYNDLVHRDPTEFFTVYASARLSFANLDFREAAEKLARLADQCPEEAARLRLLAGELSLFALESYSEALEHLEFSVQAEDEVLAQTARLYRLYVLFQLGDTGALDQALQEEALSAPAGQEAFWLAELLEAGRGARGASVIGELLERSVEETPVRQLWSAMVGQKSRDSSMVSRALASLGDAVPEGVVRGACKTAANILESVRASDSPTSSAPLSEDFQSEETLCWTIERDIETLAPLQRAELLLERARLAKRHDNLEPLEYLLEAAEAYEQLGELDRALRLVKEGLITARSWEHPGLLEAKARIAFAKESFGEAAEARISLAHFFDIPEEKAAQMAIAAKIYLDGLQDDKRAEQISKQALDLYPIHAGAHDVLVRVYRKRGDEVSVAKLIEDRIAAEGSSDELVRLYQEQADQLLSLDDLEGALAALERMLDLAPERLDAHFTRVELLAELDRWEDALAAMEGYVSSATQLRDIRPVCWKAAQVAEERLSDPGLAYEWLEKLIHRGDEHPQTQQKMCDLALRLERFEDAVEGFEKLAGLLDDPERRNAVRVKKAKILIESLFDDKRAGETVDEVLSKSPDNLDMLRIAVTFRTPAELSKDFVRAKGALRAKFAVGEDPLSHLGRLREVAQLGGEGVLEGFCADALAALRGERFQRPTEDSIAAMAGASSVLHRIVTHPDEVHPAANVALIARSAAAEVFAKSEHLPVVGKGTLVGRKTSDPVEEWLEWWTQALGIDEVELHRVDAMDAESARLPREKPAVAVGTEVLPPLSNLQRFELVRSLWLSHAGLGGFVDGDVSGPVRWVIAVAAAVLGEESALPAPTDRALVQKAKKALSRKMRRALEEPCRKLLAVKPQSIRAWAAAAEMTADRYGLLAAPSLWEVLEAVALRYTASNGKEQLAQRPAQILLGLPHCRDLLVFAVSEEHMNAREILGIAGLNADGGANG